MSNLAATLSALSAPAAGFKADARFGNLFAPAAQDEPDPCEGAFADGYARGREEGFAQAQEQAERDAVARNRIELGLGLLAEDDERRLDEKLRETILVLCEQTLAPLVADPDALVVRVTKALGLLRRSEDDRVLRLHPEDIALLTGQLPEHLKIEPDAALERGEIRVETAEGGVEDGPGQWRRALAEALGL